MRVESHDQIFFGSDLKVSFLFRSSRSMHSLHRVPPILEKQMSTSEKRLSVPVYPDLAIVTGEEIKSVEEENNLLSGDLERLNGRIPTVRSRSRTVGPSPGKTTTMRQ